jgi:ketopantoate hydroxymethyltransferase
MKGLIEDAAKTYAAQVKDRSFPGEANTYKFTKK